MAAAAAQLGLLFDDLALLESEAFEAASWLLPEQGRPALVRFGRRPLRAGPPAASPGHAAAGWGAPPAGGGPAGRSGPLSREHTRPCFLTSRPRLPAPADANLALGLAPDALQPLAPAALQPPQPLPCSTAPAVPAAAACRPPRPRPSQDAPRSRASVDMPRLQPAGSGVDSWLAGWARLAHAQGCAVDVLETSAGQELLRNTAASLPTTRPPSPTTSTGESSSPLQSSGGNRCGRLGWDPGRGRLL